MCSLKSGDEDTLRLASQGCEDDGLRKTVSDNTTFTGHYCSSFVFLASLSRPFMSSGIPLCSPHLLPAPEPRCSPWVEQLQQAPSQLSARLPDPPEPRTLGFLCAFPLPVQRPLPPLELSCAGPAPHSSSPAHSLGVVGGPDRISLAQTHVLRVGRLPAWAFTSSS